MVSRIPWEFGNIFQCELLAILDTVRGGSFSLFDQFIYSDLVHFYSGKSDQRAS